MALPEPFVALDTEPPAGTAWQGVAFGLRIEGDFQAPGFAGGPDDDAPGHIRIEVGDETRVPWESPSAQRVGVTVMDDGTPAIVVEHDASGHLRFDSRLFGRCRMQSDGTFAAYDYGEAPAWMWQRFLVGQVLPVSAMLQGLEVLHAAGVAIDGRRIAVSGVSGAGKSTTAVQLLRRGATFLTDDVVAIDPRGPELIAHPGTRLISVARGSAAAADDGALDELGTVVGATDKELLVRPRAQAGAGPLDAVYILVRNRDTPLAIERIDDVRLILSCAYDWMPGGPERELRFLDVCGRLSEAGAALRVSVPPDADAVAVAEAILAHAAQER